MNSQITPAVRTARRSKDVLDLWLRHDLTKQFGRIEPAPVELIALIEALCPTEFSQPTHGGDLEGSV